MNLLDLIEAIESDGIKLHISENGRLKYVGDIDAVNRWIGPLREHKAGIIEVLKVGAGGAALSPDQPFLNGEKTVPPTEQPVITGGEPAAAVPAITGKEQESATVITEGKQRVDPEAWVERAAICEFDGGLSRDEAEALAWREDDRRRCRHCLNLLPNGICKIAKPGGLVSANRGYRPVDILKRCEGYRPCPDDPDRRNGLERWWPRLVQPTNEQIS